MRSLALGPLSHHAHGEMASAILQAVLEAIDPATAVDRVLHVDPDALRAGDHRFALEPAARVWLLAVGKAAEAMARAAIPRLGARLAGAVVVAKHPPREPLPAGASVRVGAHPIPDERSVRAGAAAIDLMRRAGDDDVVVVALSGGASSLMVAPAAGLGVDELAARTHELLRSGAPIERINEVRTRLDRLKGGGLRRMAGATRVVTLVLSDVVDAPLSVVGSGPTMPGPTVMLASNATAVAAALSAATAHGWQARRWPPLRGEARDMGRALARRLRTADPAEPTVWVAGGETTVTVCGHGHGGRNLELALAAIAPLEGARDRTLVTFATDGEDGPTDAAGAVVDGDSAARARAAGLDVAARLADDDAYPVFDALDDLLRIGPTGTNVCDLVLALARP